MDLLLVALLGGGNPCNRRVKVWVFDSRRRIAETSHP